MKDSPNIFERKIEEQPIEQRKPLHQSDAMPKVWKQRHIDGLIIFQGLEENLPDGSTEVKIFWCTDSFKLKIWTGSLWKSVTLS